MSIENHHDVKILANAIRRHPSLRSVTLSDFFVYAHEVPNSTPLLETLTEAASSVQYLEDFQIKCHACYKRWKQSHISCTTLAPLCRSSHLQKLTLSNLGLTDDHFELIADELSRNQVSVLRELVMNENRNGDPGIRAVTSKLLSRDSIIEKLELYNENRPSQSTSVLILKQLDRNHTIKHFRVNARHQYRSEIEFFLLLNRSGRKMILNPETSSEENFGVLDAAKDNVSLLMYYLRENPGLCETTCSETKSSVNADRPSQTKKSYANEVPPESNRADINVLLGGSTTSI
jgi:hypothetical protein